MTDSRIRTNIALISSFLPLSEWTAQLWARELYEGLAGRSALLGYNLDYVYYRDSGNTRDLSQQLESRGVKGLLVLPNINKPERPELNWADYSSVFVFGNPSVHDAHSVASNHYADMTLTLQKLRGLGYRRPGLVLAQQVSETSDRDWLGSFLAHAELFPTGKTPLVFTYSGTENGSTPKNWTNWVKSEKPDVIINGGGATPAWMSELGLRIPEDIGFCDLALEMTMTNNSGIQQPTRKIGALAVTQLVTLLQNGEKGLMKNPFSLLLHGTWVPGQTLRTNPV